MARREGRGGGCFVLAWLFLGTIPARTGTRCIEPHRGSVERKRGKTFPPHLASGYYKYTGDTCPCTNTVTYIITGRRMMNEELFLSRACVSVWMREVEKRLGESHGENQTTGPTGSAGAHVQRRDLLEACVKFSSNFDGGQGSKRNDICLLFTVQIIFTTLLLSNRDTHDFICTAH